MKAQQFNGCYQMKEGTGINVSLSIFFYQEDGIHYAYCAALDILGYGNSEEEAKQSFEIMLDETLKYTISNGILTALLESLGWQKRQPPKTSALIARSRELADIVDNKAYKTILENITLPCA